MDKKEKTEASKADVKEEKCCCCDKNCDCGCQDGKECSCCCGGGCCCKKMIVKILCVLVIFLAGMGFHALLQCGFRCPLNRPLPMPVQMAPVPAFPFPAYSDAQGGNVIIINTGEAQNPEKLMNGCNCNKKCGCKKDGSYKKMKKEFKRHHKDMHHMPAEPAPLPVQAEAAAPAVK